MAARRVIVLPTPGPSPRSARCESPPPRQNRGSRPRAARRRNAPPAPPSPRSPRRSSGSAKVSCSARAHRQGAQTGERRARQRRQKARTQQIGLKIGHTPSVLGVAVFDKAAECEPVEKDSRLRRREVLAVVF